MILEGVRPQRLLLDTCAIIYLFNGDALLDEAVTAIDRASPVLVSPISAWEIGILGQKRVKSSLEFLPSPSATARRLGVPIVTRDKLILDYARTGHLDAFSC